MSHFMDRTGDKEGKSNMYIDVGDDFAVAEDEIGAKVDSNFCDFES